MTVATPVSLFTPLLGEEGGVVRTFGREDRGAGELKGPQGVSVDGVGNVFVADFPCGVFCYPYPP
jgi:hypothetical protein